MGDRAGGLQSRRSTRPTLVLGHAREPLGSRREPAPCPPRRRDVLHGEPRRHDHRDGGSGDRRRSRGRPGGRQCRDDRLSDRGGGRPADQRLAHRPVRCPAHPARRDRDLHPRLGALRAQYRALDAGCGANPAGPGRRDDGAGRAARGAAGHGEVRDDRRDRLPHLAGAARPGDRSAAGRLDRHRRELALDLLDQHPARRAGLRGRGADRPGCPGRRSRRSTGWDSCSAQDRWPA